MVKYVGNQLYKETRDNSMELLRDISRQKLLYLNLT